ncbi:MAG: proline racemase family protein, partial [Candidatus Bathyarchaeia archaeon]
MKISNILYVIDTHTEGEPTRIILAGLPRLEGNNILEKREIISKDLDWVRTSVLMEPRGHKDQFG